MLFQTFNKKDVCLDVASVTRFLFDDTNRINKTVNDFQRIVSESTMKLDRGKLDEIALASVTIPAVLTIRAPQYIKSILVDHVERHIEDFVYTIEDITMNPTRKYYGSIFVGVLFISDVCNSIPVGVTQGFYDLERHEVTKQLEDFFAGWDDMSSKFRHSFPDMSYYLKVEYCQNLLGKKLCDGVRRWMWEAREYYQRSVKTFWKENRYVFVQMIGKQVNYTKKVLDHLAFEKYCDTHKLPELSQRFIKRGKEMEEFSRREAKKYSDILDRASQWIRDHMFLNKTLDNTNEVSFNASKNTGSDISYCEGPLVNKEACHIAADAIRMVFDASRTVTIINNARPYDKMINQCTHNS